MSLVRQIAHNTIIQIAGKSLTIILALISFGLITRYLGLQNFGYYTTIYAFLQLFGILIDFGLQMSVVQLISNPQENENEILSNALTLRLVTSLIFLGLAPIAVLFFPYPNAIKIGVAVAALGFVVGSLTTTTIGLFQKHLKMSRVVVADILSKALFLILVLIAIYLNFGLLGIIIATVLDNFLNFGLLFYFAKKFVSLKPAFNFSIWKKIFIKTWPLALTISLNLIYFKGDTIILSLFRTQTEVGLYGAPYKVLEVLINLAYIFLGLILPILAASWAEKNLPQLKLIIQKSFETIIMVAVPLAFGAYFLGVPIMKIVAGPDFAFAGEILKVLILATSIIFVAGLFGYVVVAINQQRRMIKFYALNALVSLVGYLIFIPLYGVWGAAWMTVFSEVFILLTAFYVMRQTLKFSPNLKILAKSIIASLIMCLPLYFLPQLNLFLLLILAGALYFSALCLLKCLPKKMILEIIKLKSDK